MEILNVKVEKGTKEKLERLVRARDYKNKSEASRKLIEEHFKHHPELFAEDDFTEVVRDAGEMTNRELDRLSAVVFGGRKTAPGIVREGRERWVRSNPLGY